MSDWSDPEEVVYGLDSERHAPKRRKIPIPAHVPDFVRRELKSTTSHTTRFSPAVDKWFEQKALGAIARQQAMVQSDPKEKNRRWNDDFLFNTETQDKEVVRSMNLVAENIQDWVNLVFPHPLAWKVVRPQDKEWFQAWAPKAKEYFGVAGDIGGTKSLVKAWIWRIIWEELFNDSEDKWANEYWAAFGKLEVGLRDVSKPGQEQTDFNQQQKWHRITRYSTGRLMYMTHGSHTDELRLLNKIITPFHHLLKDDLKLATKSAADKALRSICKHAVEVDFWHLTSLHKIKLTWEGPPVPYHPDPHGFPFKAWGTRGGGRHMEPMVRKDVKKMYDDRVLDGYPVDFIRCPTLTVHSNEVVWDEDETCALPTIGRPTTNHYEPLRVMMNNNLAPVEDE